MLAAFLKGAQYIDVAGRQVTIHLCISLLLGESGMHSLVRIFLVCSAVFASSGTALAKDYAGDVAINPDKVSLGTKTACSGATPTCTVPIQPTLA